MSAVMALPTRPHLERTGMLQVARAIGADVIAFDDEDWVEVHPPHVEHTTAVYVAKSAYEAERLISIRSSKRIAMPASAAHSKIPWAVSMVE
jgi:uncharacterized protein (DUF362 family)